MSRAPYRPPARLVVALSCASICAIGLLYSAQPHAGSDVQQSLDEWQTEQGQVTMRPYVNPSSYQQNSTDEDMRRQREIIVRYLQSSAFKERVEGIRGLQPRGILINSGGRRLLTNMIVLLKVLRGHLRCRLPVEVVWHSNAEMDNATLAALNEEFGPVYGRYLHAAPYPAHHRAVEGGLQRFAAKAYALHHCRFREVLMLDADAMPLFNPEQLFEEPTYSVSGNLFWPDFWSWWVGADAYRLMGLDHKAAKDVLDAGRGFVKRDSESGYVLLDRAQHADVLEMLLWASSFSEKVYRHVHGDKDTYALAFAAAGKAHMFSQVSVPPGGAFTWRANAIEIKETGKTFDGWQMMACFQFTPNGEYAFLHRTMRKYSLDEDSWPLQLITGPLPMKWTRYYLDMRGPTKAKDGLGAPDSAFAKLQLNGEPPAAEAQGVSSTDAGGCDEGRLQTLLGLRKLALPVDRNRTLEAQCRSRLPAMLGIKSSKPADVEQALRDLHKQRLTWEYLESTGPPDADMSAPDFGTPVPALVVSLSQGAPVDNSSYITVAIGQAYQALEWLRANVGKFPIMKS